MESHKMIEYEIKFYTTIFEKHRIVADQDWWPSRKLKLNIPESSAQAFGQFQFRIPIIL